MANFRINHIFLFFLVAAFLIMQLSPTHIHLAETHDHGSHHHHDIQVHAHKSIDDNIAGLELSHHTNILNTVDLDYEFSSSKVEKLEKPPATLLISFFFDISLVFANAQISNLNTDNWLNYFSQSIVNPRAPPAFS